MFSAAQRQFFRFAVVGVINTAVDWVIFFSLSHTMVWFFDRPLVANALAFAGGFTNSFFLNRWWTFQSTQSKHIQQASKFFLVALVGLALSEVVIAVVLPLTDSRVVSKFVAVIITLSWNFLGGKYWAFRT